MRARSFVLECLSVVGALVLTMALLGIMQKTSSAQQGGYGPPPIQPCTGKAAMVSRKTCGDDAECNFPNCSGWFKGNDAAIKTCDAPNPPPTGNCGGCLDPSDPKDRKDLPTCGNGGDCLINVDTNECKDGTGSPKYKVSCAGAPEGVACYQP